jgi:hypothetical protein
MPYSVGRQCFAYFITSCRSRSIPADCVSFAAHKRHQALFAMANLLSGRAANAVWISQRTEYSISPKLYDNYRLSACRIGPGGVRPAKIASTSTDRDAPTTAQRGKLRTVCGPVEAVGVGQRLLDRKLTRIVANPV